MAEPKHCPIKRMRMEYSPDGVKYLEHQAHITFGDCEGETCAWWEDVNGQCLMLSIAYGLLLSRPEHKGGKP